MKFSKKMIPKVECDISILNFEIPQNLNLGKKQNDKLKKIIINNNIYLKAKKIKEINEQNNKLKRFPTGKFSLPKLKLQQMCKNKEHSPELSCIIKNNVL